MTKRYKQKRALRVASARNTGPRVFGIVAVIAIIIVSAWFLARTAFQPNTGPPSATAPGPIGGPSIAQDVNTLVGQRAPEFTLADSEGKSYTIKPGSGRPLVLVFHMGIT